MRRAMLVLGVLGFSSGAYAMGSTAVTLGGGGPNQKPPGQAQHVEIPRGDPLFGHAGSVLETPVMAPSTGLWTLPGRMPPPVVQNFRSVGVQKDD